MTTRWGLLVLLGSVIGGGVLFAGCDQVPSQAGSGGTPPLVSTLVVPDTVTIPSGGDSPASVEVDVAATVDDPDGGAVERVVFTLDPVSSPRRPIVIRVPGAGNQRYGGSFSVELPVEEEVYAVQVYAVDRDSLVSNRALGQFRLLPTP